MLKLKISRDQLVMRIIKLARMNNAEAHGSIICFYSNGKYENGNEKFPNYKDSEILNKLKDCGYL